MMMVSPCKALGTHIGSGLSKGLQTFEWSNQGSKFDLLSRGIQDSHRLHCTLSVASDLTLGSDRTASRTFFAVFRLEMDIAFVVADSNVDVGNSVLAVTGAVTGAGAI